MKYDKIYLRKKYLLLRKQRYLKYSSFNFHLIFKLIKDHFNKKKIVIAGYYPSNYEVNILNFLKAASKKNFKIMLPIIKPSSKMIFSSWEYNDPLNVSVFGTLEPKVSNNKKTPDLVLVPLVAFDDKLNRIGYGKGYYDRILHKLNKNKKKTVSLGVAYSFQQCDRIKVNKYDFKLDYVFTERGIISSK